MKSQEKSTISSGFFAQQSSYNLSFFNIVNHSHLTLLNYTVRAPIQQQLLRSLFNRRSLYDY
jgi:hypothetical protein